MNTDEDHRRERGGGRTMIIECPHCFAEFDADMSSHEEDTGFYCPDCGSGFLYSTEGVS